MKNLIPVLIIFVMINYLQAQSQLQEVIYLKNGGVVKGTILEQSPEKGVKLQTRDENIFVFEWAQIEKIVKENVTPKNEQVISVKTSIEKKNDALENNYFNTVEQSKSFYLKACFGYGLKANAQRFVNFTGSIDNYSTDVFFDSYGKGFSAGLSAGYMFSDYFGAELGLQYLFGTSISTFDRDFYSNTVEGTSAAFFIIPSVIIEIPVTKAFAVYTRLGVILSLPKVRFTENLATKLTSYSYLYTKDEYEDYGGISWGTSNSVGAHITVTKSISFTSEILYHNLLFLPSKRKHTSHYENGVDRLYNIVNPERNYTYTHAKTDLLTSSQVGHQFSSMGFNLGISVYF